MAVVGRAFALVALLLVTTAAAAVSPVSIAGRLRWSEPSHVEGLVVADADPASTAILLPTHTGEREPELLSSARANVVLHRWVVVYVSTAQDPETRYETRDDSLPEQVSHLQVSWVAPLGEGQILLQGLEKGGVQLAAADCGLRALDSDSDLRFPSKTGPRPAPRWHEEPADASRLEASCQAHGSVTANAGRILLYGMELHVVGDGVDRIVWTGSRVVDAGEPPQPGAPTGLGAAPERAMGYFMVTQALEITVDEEEVRVEYDLPGNVTIRSRALAADGRLRMAASHGTLDWGARRDEGDVAPVDADGRFRFGRGQDDRIELSGTTAGGPAAPGGSAGRLVWAVAATAAVGAVGLAVAGLWALFSRLGPSEVLAHPRRQRILEMVTAQPGIQINTVAQALGITWPKVAYHVALLERHGQVSQRRIGGRTALFPRAGFRGRELSVVLLRRESHRRAYEALRATPGLDQVELAHALGLDRSRVSRVLGGLREAGLVEADPGPGRARYRAVPAGPTGSA